MAAVLRLEEVAAWVNAPTLQSVLDELVSERVVYFPIRHHSPACACHLERLLRDWKPQAILIEGPACFTPLIPLILHSKTKAPFAVYVSFVDQEEPEASEKGPDFGPTRHAAYYPFCDYSPELVSLRVGTELGASLRFIDLDYPDQIREERNVEKEGAPRVESLLAERPYQRSRYLQDLARRAGCRDHNDLWDHLFETRLAQAGAPNSVERFIRDVAGWCYFARADATPEMLRAESTHAREEAMARAINLELSRGTQRIVVVTGGFHTVALPRLVRAKGCSSTKGGCKKEDSVACLVRYSFEQLDALNGYAAGMPSPFYYDQLWRAAVEQEAHQAFSTITTQVLVDLGRLTRRKKMASALSAADEIAALEQASRLALIRGHPGPTREDLLDSIRSCFVKGAIDAEGKVVLSLALHTLGGTGVGEVPPEAGAPPLVEDFRRTARKMRLSIEDSLRRKSSLDLYRKTVHRQVSRFFHSLTFLEVPFANLAAGPDFVKGSGLERIYEHWTYQWTPQTESQLVEASIYGATIQDAAASRLIRTIVELEDIGQGRSAAIAVGMLVHACRMGLHQHTGRLLALIAQQVGEDPAIASLAGALNQLVLLWQSREPLEAHRLAEIPQLIRAAYERACYLLQDLASTPDDAAEQALQSIESIRDALHASNRVGQSLDKELFWVPLSRAIEQSKGPALLIGGASGLLHEEGRLNEPELLKNMAGYLNATSANAGQSTGFLIGLLRTCRELAWRQPALVSSVESMLAGWSEEEFIARIPHLRLAFANLTPRETDLVAGAVAQLHGGQPLGLISRSELTEVETIQALRLNLTVTKALEDDGLGEWIKPDVKSEEPT